MSLHRTSQASTQSLVAHDLTVRGEQLQGEWQSEGEI